MKTMTLTFLIFIKISIYSSEANAQVKDSKKYDIANQDIISPPEVLNLNPFYKKYINANGIHIISSQKVPDEAIYAAYKTILFMTNGLPKDILNELVTHNTKVAIMARYEGTTDIPEHSFLANDTLLNWDVRARGLGGTLDLPLTSCAEENLLCYQIDKYHAEDILIHEFAHTIHGVGILPLNEKFNDQLQELLDKAISEGKYENTYAATNLFEYWAEGVQNWFNVNAEVPESDGKHNALNTKEELKDYDPDLYELISRYFSETESSPSCHAKENKYIIN